MKNPRFKFLRLTGKPLSNRLDTSDASPSGRKFIFYYLLGLLLPSVIFGAQYNLQHWLGREVPYLLSLTGILLSAWIGGLGPGLLATLVSAFFTLYFNGLTLSSVKVVEIMLFIFEGLLISLSQFFWRKSNSDRVRLLNLEKQLRISEKVREQRATFLAEASAILSSNLDYEATLKSVSKLAVPTLADWCVVYIVTDEGRVEQLSIAHKDPYKIRWAKDLQSKYPEDFNAPGGVGESIRNQKPILIPEISNDLLRQGAKGDEHYALLKRLGLRSVMIVPFSSRTDSLGALTFVTAESKRSYTQEDLEFAAELARRASLAMDNALLYKSARAEIRERKVVEEELLRSRDQLKIILEGVSEGITVQEPSGKLLFANDAAARLIGYDNALDLIKTPVQQVMEVFELYDENNRPFPINRLPGRQALLGKKTKDSLIKFKIKNSNQEQWSLVRASPVFDKNGRVQFAINVFQDVTEKRRIEETRSRLAAIVNSTQDAVYSKNLEGVITSWNPGAEKLFGYKAKEIIGRNVGVLFPKELINEHRTVMEKLKDGGALKSFETSRTTKSGQVIEVSVSISPIKNERGRIIGASTIARDIRERKDLERRKDEFIAVASHELKTPLTSIKAFAQLLERRLSGGGADRQSIDYLGEVMGQVDRLTNLVSGLLDITKMRTGRFELQKEQIDLSKMIAEIVVVLSKTTKHKLVMDATGKILVKVDAGRISQVLTNLLTNAIKFSPEEKPILVKTKHDKAMVVVSIKDYGQGISKADQEKLFQRFSQTGALPERESLGTGLGLYISSEIIKGHGGKIWVESSKGKGATFFFSLPLT